MKSGLTGAQILVLIVIDGQYRDYLDYTAKPPKEVLLTEKLLATKIPDILRASQVDLKIFSAGGGEVFLEDFAASLSRAKIQMPNGSGVLYKSGPLIDGEDKGPEVRQELVLDSLTAGRLLTSIKVYHAAKFDGIEFLYDDQSSQIFGGRCADTNTSEFPIDARKGESLIGFCVWLNEGITGLEILTSFGRRSTCYGCSTAGVSR